MMQDLSKGTKMFDLMTLALEFDLLFENFNFVNNMWIKSARALVYHMSILVTDPFQGNQQFWPFDLNLGVWPTFEYFNLIYHI